MKLVRNIVAGATVFAATAVLPLQAYAQSCADLWWERNNVYYQAGKCFKTARAKRAFPNAGCTSNNPRLTAAQNRRVRAIRRQERSLGC